MRGKRNSSLIDPWSFMHLASGVALGWLIDPFWALVLLIAWEPFEILFLGPALYKWKGIDFGYEDWRNSISDIVFDALGVAIGAYLLR